MDVCCLALSHDLTILASGSYDTTVKIWNLDSYVEMRMLECGGGYVNAVDFSADDKRLYTGSNDGSLKAWNVSTGDELDSIQAHETEGHIRGLCTTVAGTLVATASYDHNIKLWSTELETFKLVTTLEGHTDTVYAVVSTSTVLVSASGDKTVKIWDLTTYQELHSLSDGDRQEAVYSVAVTQDGQRIISGGHDSVVRLWCLTTGELLFCFRGHSQAIRFVMATTDGTKALSGSQDTTFRVWNLNVINLKKSVSSGHNKDVTDISVNNNGSLGASSSMDGTVKIWHCETAQEIHNLKGHTTRVVSLAMSTDGIYVVSAAKDSFVKVWDVKDGKMLASVEIPQPRLVRFNETHELVLVGCEDNRLFIWNWRNTEIPHLRSVPLPAFTTMEMVIDHDIVCTCSFGAEICQVDIANNNVSMLCQGPTTGYKSVMILPDGKAVLLGKPTSNHLIFWEMSSSREIYYSTGLPPEAHVTAMDITNDEKRVLCGSSTGTLSQINLKPPEIIQKYENTRLGKSIRFVAVLKNDRHFVFVDETNTVELRSLDDKEKVILEQPASEVTSVCPVGLRFLLVGCKNGEFVCFYLAGACGRHKGHDCAVTRMASCIKDGHFLYFISGSENGSVKCWYLTDSIPCQWINIWIRNDVHSYPVTALAFIPGSEDVVSGSYDNLVKRINGDGIVSTFPFQCYDVAALCVVGDSMFATYVRSLSVVDWSLRRVERKKRLHSGAGREQVARIFLPTGRVVSKGSNHSLVYWDRNSGNIIRTLHGHTHHIRALALVPGGKFLLSGSRDNVLKLWCLETGELVDEFHFERFVLAISCAPNGIVCVGLQGGQVCFMRVNNLTRPPC